MPHVLDAVTSTLRDLLAEEGFDGVTLTPDTVLLESGLDSLGLAVLVTRLENELGYDPFSIMTEAVYPRTLGEFADIYREYAPRAEE